MLRQIGMLCLARVDVNREKQHRRPIGNSGLATAGRLSTVSPDNSPRRKKLRTVSSDISRTWPDDRSSLPSGRGQRRNAVAAGASSEIHAYPISSSAEAAPRSF